MTGKMDLRAPPEFVAWARRQNANYARRRREYRKRHPIRNFALDGLAIYVAPVELRPELPSDREGSG